MAIYANYYTMDLFYAASENKSGTAIRFSDSGPEGNYYTCSLSVTDTGAEAATSNLGTGSASSYTYKGKYHFLGLGDSRKPITYTRPGGTYSKSLRAGSYGNYARVYPVEGVYITKSSAYVTYSNTTSTLILDGTDVSYSTTITPSSKRYIKSIVVTMGGVDVSSTSVTDNAILITKVTGDIDIAVETGTLSFKHFYRNDTLIGSGVCKFRPYTATEPARLPQLPAPKNVTVDGTTASWDAVENATSYELFVDGVSIGSHSL